MDGPDIKLDMEQRARAIDLETQVIDQPAWATEAIVWQRDELAARDARIAELEELVVWCVERSVDRVGHTIWLDGDKWIEIDGTPTSILAACERAKKEPQRG